MLRLLIVDDEVETREGILERMPWSEMGIGSTEQADNGINGLKKASDFKPDIVLTDVRMPRMDGVEMSVKLRELFPECKIIFMSGYSDKEYLKSAIALRAVSYVEKPINLAELRQSIDVAVGMCLEENNKKKIESEINELVKTSMPLLRSELALRLSMNKPDTCMVESLIKKTGLEITPDSIFITILLKYDAENIMYTGQTEKIKEETFKRLDYLYKLHNLRGLSALREEGYFIIHLIGRAFDAYLFTQEKLQAFCNGLLESMEDKSHVFITVGKKVQGLPNIHESYKTSVIAMQKAFLKEYGCIVFYRDSNDMPYDFRPCILNEFTGDLAQQKKEQAVFLIKRTISDIKRCDNTLVDNIKNFCYTMISEAEKLARVQGFSILQGDLRENILWAQILKIDVISVLEQLLISIVDAYFSGLRMANEKNDPISMALKYIHNNYRNGGLSVNDISEYIHMAPTYVCNQFKSKTGRTINSYITEYRLEKARELLGDPELKIAEIAAMIGLNDGGYFARMFRKATGLTPSEYRERSIL